MGFRVLQMLTLPSGGPDDVPHRRVQGAGLGKALNQRPTKTKPGPQNQQLKPFTLNPLQVGLNCSIQGLEV